MASLPTQPRQGHPCNGCGMCCLIEPCPISLEVFGANSQVCRALEFDEGRYWCGLMRHPEEYGATLPELEAIAPGASNQYHKTLIGAEVGCDSAPVDFNSYWCLSSDGEHYSGEFYTREDALAEGPEWYPDGFWLGVATAPKPLSAGVFAASIVEQARDCLEYDGWGLDEAHFEPSKEALDDLQQRLRSAVDNWVVAQGLTPRWFVINEAEWIVSDEEATDS